MGDYFDMWLKGGTWYDMQQRQELEALSSSHARTTSRLRSQLSQESRRSDDLATRLSKVEDALVAVVELEDLRAVMDSFSDAAATRRWARDVVARIPALGRVPSSASPQAPPDVPGYWLHPAVRALDAQLSGDAVAARAAGDEARARDAAKSAQFFAAAAILSGTPAAGDDLAALWPTTTDVSSFQRSLWLAVADGRLGGDARDQLVGALRWALRPGADDGADAAGGDPDDPSRSVPLVRVAVPQAPTPTFDPLLDEVRRTLLGRSRPTTPAAAASLLADVRKRVTAALEPVGPPSAPEQATAVAAPAEPAVDAVADLLAQLVSAGGPGEEPLVARLAEIRQALAAIGAATEIAAPSERDEKTLDVVELLRNDLEGQGVSPGAHAVAVRVLAPQIESVATELATAAAEPIEQTRELRVPGVVSVTLTSSGPTETGWRERAAQRVHVSDGVRQSVPAMIGGGAVVALGAVLAITAAPLAALVAVPGLGLAAWGGFQRRSGERDHRARVERAVAEAQTEITQETQKLQGELLSAAESQRRAPADLAALQAALRAG